MEKIYFSSTLLWDFPMESIMKFAAIHQYEGIEIWAQHALFKQFSTEEIMTLKEKYKLEMLVHSASWDLNISSINEGIRNQSIEEIKKSILFSKEIQAKDITIHPGRESLNNKLSNWHKGILSESLKIIAEFAYKNSVNLSLELMETEPKELICTPEFINDTIKKVDFPMGVTFDIAHLKEERLMQSYINEIINIDKIHVSNKKGNIYHVPLPDGDYDCKNMIKKLLKLKLPIVIEGYDENCEMDSLIKNTNFIKNLLQDI